MCLFCSASFHGSVAYVQFILCLMGYLTCTITSREKNEATKLFTYQLEVSLDLTQEHRKDPAKLQPRLGVAR